MVVHQLQSKVRFRFEPPWCWLNLELDFRFGSGKSMNLELNLVFGSAGSGSNLGSEPNCGITSQCTTDYPLQYPRSQLTDIAAPRSNP